MTNLKQMKKSDIITLMEGEGMMFSRDLTKDQLINLYNAQSENKKSEEETNMENLQKTAAEVTENSQEEIVYDNPADENNFENLEVPDFFAEGQTEKPATETTVEDVPDVESEKSVDEVIPEVEGEVIPETDEPAADAKPETEAEKPAETPAENKRRQGKGIVAFKNNEEYMTFPSIKATAQHFKDLLNLGHMPFTPIMKSVRQGIDWNEYSFKHENEADLHIPESLKKKIEESKQKASQEAAKTETPEVPTATTETENAPSDEVIEEIVEEIIEEPVTETTEPVAEQSEEKSEETVETK